MLKIALNTSIFSILVLVGSFQVKAQVSCPNISAIPLPIRAEGVTEQIANLTITCVAPVSATADITLSFSPVLAVTSKVLIPATGATEALAVTGAGSVSGIRSGSSLVFSGIPVGPAASNITITNIRIDATGAALNASVTAQASVSGSGITAGTTNSATVALVQPGLAPQTITGVTNYAACSAITVSSGPAFSIHFGEGFPTAFKTQGCSTNASVDSAVANNTETGYFIASGGINNQ